jgi:hypothetical protein
VSDPVEQAIVEVAKDNPTDGYRMVWALTRRKLGQAINRKRVLRVMREQKLIQRRARDRDRTSRHSDRGYQPRPPRRERARYCLTVKCDRRRSPTTIRISSPGRRPEPLSARPGAASAPGLLAGPPAAESCRPTTHCERHRPNGALLGDYGREYCAIILFAGYVGTGRTEPSI